MISQMCKLKAAAYLAHERERSAEEQRQEEQLALMRLEQLQVCVCVCVCARARVLSFFCSCFRLADVCMSPELSN